MFLSIYLLIGIAFCFIGGREVRIDSFTFNDKSLSQTELQVLLKISLILSAAFWPLAIGFAIYEKYVKK